MTENVRSCTCDGTEGGDGGEADEEDEGGVHGGDSKLKSEMKACKVAAEDILQAGATAAYCSVATS